MTMEKPELISFKLCPFVQRSLITLLYKEIDYSITYIDLANKPDWFLKISPFGKVPLLKTDGEVLFESAIINEYLDEITPPSIHPAEPLKKAKSRAWIEFSSGLYVVLYHLLAAKDKESADKCEKDLAGMMRKLEDILGKGPYFNGDNFTLADTAYAPFFMRLFIIEKRGGASILKDLPKAAAYGNALMELPAVKDSVVPDFEELFVSYLKNKESYLSSEW